MPVTGLFYIADPSPLLRDALTERILKLHTPITTSSFGFEYRLFRETPDPTLPQPQTTPPNLMQQLELSYVRGKMFVLTTNIAAGNQQGEMVLVQREFAEIARLKLNALWMQQQFVRAEGVGMEFEAWRVRVGGLMMQNTNRGLFIEVEYFSTDYLSAGAPIIREILRTFVPETLQQLNIPADKGRFYGDPLGTEGEREFTLMDTGRQYMEMLRLRPRDDGSARRL